MASTPEPVERDSRGILDPALLQQHLHLTRYPPTAALEGVVARFWAVTWDLPPGQVHRQQVLTHPGANLSVGLADGACLPDGPVVARLDGVATSVTVRTLIGAGWSVAALTTPGGLGALLDVPAHELTDRTVPLGRFLALDEPQLVEQVRAGTDEPGRVAVLASALERAVRPQRVEDARRVAAVAALAEADRTLRRVDDLCAVSGMSRRTLQRLFREHVGRSASWVLRRYRLLDAAEAVRDGQDVSWAELAISLGYADQPHLVRDFHAAIGQPPAAYARGLQQRDGQDARAR